MVKNVGSYLANWQLTSLVSYCHSDIITSSSTYLIRTYTMQVSVM